MRESLIEKLAEISIRVFIWGKTKGIQDLEEISADLNSLASDIAEKDWHTGTPTEAGLYVIAFRFGNKIEHEIREMYYSPMYGMTFGIKKDIVAWQKIEPYRG